MGLGTRAFWRILVLAIALVVADSGLAQEASKAPIESMSVNVPEKSRAEFLGTLSRFAQQNRLAIDTKAIAPNGIEYRAWLENPDMQMVAVNAVDPQVFFIFFYYGTSGGNNDGYIRMARSALACMVTGIAGVTIANDP
jgi:hypothetical protein